MGTYRKQIQIVGDILYAAEELTIDQNGASITKLIAGNDETPVVISSG